MTQTETETLTGYLATDARFHIGRYDRIVPAGTHITVELDDMESGRAIVLARLASNPRICEYVYAAAIIPA